MTRNIEVITLSQFNKEKSFILYCFWKDNAQSASLPGKSCREGNLEITVKIKYAPAFQSASLPLGIYTSGVVSHVQHNIIIRIFSAVLVCNTRF